MVYYGGSGPTRLPIGREGQVLVSTGVDPEWVTLGETDFTYFVAPTGVDLPAPIHGKTWDKPWKTIRYACEQVERGPRNPDARYLLELNRVFIQREVTEFIQRQISTNTAPFTSAFVYDDFKCERDVGFTLDAVIYDLGHGGNIKSRGVANSLIGGLSEGETEVGLVGGAGAALRLPTAGAREAGRVAAGAGHSRGDPVHRLRIPAPPRPRLGPARGMAMEKMLRRPLSRKRRPPTASSMPR
jgi:hypothetical protein